MMERQDAELLARVEILTMDPVAVVLEDDEAYLFTFDMSTENRPSVMVDKVSGEAEVLPLPEFERVRRMRVIYTPPGI